MNIKVAILLTCYNRKKTTCACIGHVLASANKAVYNYDVFLLDDGSCDGTTAAVLSAYPQVNVTQGTGQLYWCGGMRKVWDVAAKNATYDAFLLINDDILVEGDAISKLEDMHKKHPDSILVGACREEDIENASYGFFGASGIISPVDPPARLTMKIGMNGNCVWVPKCVYDVIGNFRSVYRHSRGDFDYGWRALKAGFDVLLTPFYVGRCRRHDLDKPKWQLPGLSITKRWGEFNSPKGVPLDEYFAISYLRNPWLGWLSVIKWPYLFIKGCFADATTDRPRQKM